MRGSYPHPVLDASDDVASVFEVVNVVIAPGLDDIEITFKARMDDPDLSDRLAADTAHLVASWRCGATLSAGHLELDVVATHADGRIYRAFLDQERVRENVSVDVRLVAARPDKQYRLARQNPEYGDAEFEIAPGDVLGEAGTFTFAAEKLYDPLRPPIGSCFRFDKVKGRAKGIKVSFNADDVVAVQFTSALHEAFGSLKSRPDLQIALVVLPALMETITFIRANEGPDGEDMTDRAWFVALQAQIEALESEGDSALTLAQKMLAHPIDGVLARGIIEEDDE